MAKLIRGLLFAVLAFSLVLGQEPPLLATDAPKSTASTGAVSTKVESVQPTSIVAGGSSTAAAGGGSSTAAAGGGSSTAAAGGGSSTAAAGDGSSTAAAGESSTAAGSTAAGGSSTAGGSTAEPTTTVAPPQVGNWSVVNENGTVCLLLDMAAKFDIEYTMKNQMNANFTLQLPVTATVDNSSTCSGTDGTEHMVLDFDGSWLSLEFGTDGSKAFLKNITLNASLATFPEAAESFKLISVGNLKLFEVTKTHSYLCSKEQIVKSDTEDVLTFSSVKMQAYRNSGNFDFAIAENCDNDLGDIVPIAVGCALAALVVIVLIAYLVGRRHKRQKGYESV